MANLSGVSNHFSVAKEGFVTTTSSPVASGATTVQLTSVAGYSNGDTVVLVIDAGDVNKKQAFTGVVDTGGLQISNVVWTEGANTSHILGAPVIDYVTASHQSMTTKGLLVSHNQDGTLKTDSVDSTQIKANAITTPKLASGSVTADKLAPTIWDGSMSALNPITTSYTNIASVTLPAVTSAHKYLIVASFYFNHNGGASARDYTGAIRNGTTTLVQTTWSAMANYYINTVSGNIVFTSSSSGGETINFSVLRSTDNGGLVTANRSFYSIVDLGLA